jgi:competence ComEA-like helix-hairpin-helix protein
MKIALLFPLLAVLSAQAQDLPPGKGKAVLEEVCSACHGPEAVMVLHQSKDAWKDVVDDMIGKGAAVNSDQEAIIVDYLTANFGPQVNVNKGAAKEIADTLGLTPAEADAIVKYRTDHGNFKDFDALAKVDGVDRAKLEAKKSLIAF